MGRSKKNKRKNDNRHQGGSKRIKRRSVARFWVMDCQDSKPLAEGETFDIELLVTRTVLEDDYYTAASLASSKDGKESRALSKGESQENASSVDEEASDKPSKSKDDDSAPHVADLKSEHVSIIKLAGLYELKDHSDGADKGASLEKGMKDKSQPVVGVKKSSSARRPMPKFYNFEKDFKPLPNGDCGDGILNPHPKDEVPDKYWSQRRRFFKLFDSGIQLDKESWYSVTPEAIATHIANHLVGDREDVTVLDPFCGCGGNAIAFAQHCGVKQVICVDLDISKLEKAYHNASIYGVEKKLLLVHGNAFETLSLYSDGKLREPEPSGAESSKDGSQSLVSRVDTSSLPQLINAIFLSPPWGGVDYGGVGKHGFDLSCINIATGVGRHMDGELLLERAAAAIGHKMIAYFLPRNINGLAFARSALKAGFTDPIVMEQNVLNGKLKTVTSYLGLGA